MALLDQLGRIIEPNSPEVKVYPGKYIRRVTKCHCVRVKTSRFVLVICHMGLRGNAQLSHTGIIRPTSRYPGM